MTLQDKIQRLRKYAPTQPDILLCSRILDVCDAAERQQATLAALCAVLPYAKEEAESLDEHRGYGESVNREADAARAAVRLAEAVIAQAEGRTA